MGRSVQLVIKPEGGVDYPEFGVIHGGPEDCMSTLVIPEVVCVFPLGPIDTSQNQESNICSHIRVIDITLVSRCTSSIQVCHVDNVDDLWSEK